MTVQAVLFDLDDTLYLQATWLRGAWAFVAETAYAVSGLDPDPLLASLVAIAGEGSDRGRIIDRALLAVGAEGVDPMPLVQAFKAYRSGPLEPLPGVRSRLSELRRLMPIGLVTDGDPVLQRSKIESLGLSDAFDTIVLSDELGRKHRKPDPRPFTVALGALGVSARNAVFVGDRPDKDIVGAQAVGMTTIRVLSGEYAAMECAVPTVAASDVCAAIDLAFPCLVS